MAYTQDQFLTDFAVSLLAENWPIHNACDVLSAFVLAEVQRIAVAVSQ